LNISIDIVLTIAGIIISILFFRYGIMKDKFDNDKKTAERLKALESACKDYDETCVDFKNLSAVVTEMKVKIDVFWKALDNRLADMLKSPTHLDKDILMEKYKHDLLTFDETLVLKTILEEEWNQKKSLDLAMFLSRLDVIIAVEKNAAEKISEEIKPKC
jgi:hypothetical protein